MNQSERLNRLSLLHPVYRKAYADLLATPLHPSGARTKAVKKFRSLEKKFNKLLKGR